MPVIRELPMSVIVYPQVSVPLIFRPVVNSGAGRDHSHHVESGQIEGARHHVFCVVLMLFLLFFYFSIIICIYKYTYMYMYIYYIICKYSIVYPTHFKLGLTNSSK